MSDSVLAPASGMVPQNPVLWLFLPTAQAKQYVFLPRIRATLNGTGPGVAVGVTPEAAGDDLAAYRVQVVAGAAGPLKIDLLNDQSAVVRSWSLQVDSSWKAPSGSIAKIKVSREQGGRSCTPTRTRNLHFPASAAAYRIVVGAVADGGAPGSSKGFVLPRALDPLWGREESRNGGSANLALGYANLFGDTFDGSHGADITVLALLPDGSEQPVTRKPLKVLPP
jgi:hypothetical protein